MPRKEPGYAERAQMAAKAKQALLEKTRATSQANAAQVAEREAARIELDKARQIRIAERKAANKLAAERLAAEKALEAARKAQAAREEAERKETERLAKLEAEAALLKEQKALRDAKYAARKSRQR